MANFQSLISTSMHHRCHRRRLLQCAMIQCSMIHLFKLFIFILTIQSISTDIQERINLERIKQESSSILEVSYPNISFFSQSDTDLTQLALDISTNKVFVGAINKLHQVSISANQILTLEKSVFIDGGRESQCDETKIGPDCYICTKDNVIKTLNVIVNDRNNTMLLACGTHNYGQCYAFHTLNIEQNLTLNNNDEVHKVYSANNVGSFRSVISFEGLYHKTKAIYVAREDDNCRPTNRKTPFFSALSIGKKKLEFFHSIDSAYFSLLDFHPASKPHTVRIIYGFYHKSFTYVLTVQPQNSHKLETRLSRICSDDNYFNSYIEIPLTCSGALVAKTASLSSIVFKEVFAKQSPVYHERTNSANTLFVAFEKTNENLSHVCSYDLAALNKEFDDAIENCFTRNDRASLLTTMNGPDSKECKAVEGKNKLMLECGKDDSNRYILGKHVVENDSLLQLENEQITAIGAITINETNVKEPKTLLLIGTEQGNLFKWDSSPPPLFGNELFNPVTFISQLEPKSGPVLPNFILHTEKATFYGLTKRSLFQIPLDSCSVYVSCTSCYRYTSGKCRWYQSKCVHVNEVGVKVELKCPPEVFDFEPKFGPPEGGTNITFKGRNLGESHGYIDPHNPNIKVGQRICKVISQKMNEIICKLSESTNPSQTQETATITLTVVHSRPESFLQMNHDINGSIELSQPYTFVQFSFTGIFPTFGPITGGTNVLLYGRNFHIGSKLNVNLGSQSCQVLKRTRHYVICQTTPIEHLFNQSEQVTLLLDSAKIVINNDSIFSATFVQPMSIEEDDRENLIENINTGLQPFDRVVNEFFHNDTSLLFGKSFQYRHDPTVSSIVNSHTIFSGGTYVHFDGTNLNASQFPVLEITSNSIMENQIQIPCAVEYGEYSLQCLMPSLNLNDLWHEWIKMDFFLRFDGFITNRSILNMEPIQYHKDPEFDTMNKILHVSSDSKMIPITGRHLVDNLPYEITLNDTYACILSISSFRGNSFSCKANVTDLEMEDLLQTNLMLQVSIGTKKTYKIGHISFIKTGAAFFNGIIVACVVAVLVLLTACLYVFFNPTRVSKKQGKTYTELQMNTIPSRTLEQLFSDVYHSSEQYESLLASNKIITINSQEKLELVGFLNEGNYGITYKSIFRDQEVVTKMLKKCDDDEKIKCLLEEAMVMKDFSHQNVLSLIGVTMFDNLPVLLLPFMRHADLHNFVKCPDNLPTVLDLLDFSIQIAEGMEYLSQMNFVHRDLAARNCLIDGSPGTRLMVKVADFGLSRKFQEKNYYRILDKTRRVPFRWMALESFTDHKCTIKSDVWSFGVVVWELLERGKTPYENWEDEMIIQRLSNGYRLPRPAFCPEAIYAIVMKCWLKEPNDRPTFSEIVYEIKHAIHLINQQPQEPIVVPTPLYQNLDSIPCPFDYNIPNIKQKISQYKDMQYERLSAFPTAQRYDDDEGDNMSISQIPQYAPPSYTMATALPPSNSLTTMNVPINCNSITTTTSATTGAQQQQMALNNRPLSNIEPNSLNYRYFGSSETLPRGEH